MFFRIVYFLLVLPLKIFFPTKVIGKKNLPKRGKGAILSSNHTSNMDGFMLAANHFEKKYYVAKKELFKNKFMDFCLRHVGLVKINREANDIHALKTCMKLLKDNKKLVIFPEGTRHHNENMELGEIKGGVAMFAIKTRMPVVPIFISNTPKIFRKITIFIGKAFELNDFYGKKVDSEVLLKAGDIVATKMEENRLNYLKTLTQKS